MTKTLPLGTAIRKKKDDEIYIVVGKYLEINTKKIEYNCIKYPYGLVKINDIIRINENDIETIILLGNIN